MVEREVTEMDMPTVVSEANPMDNPKNGSWTMAPLTTSAQRRMHSQPILQLKG